MGDVAPHLPDTVGRQIAEIERRLRILENTNRLTNASIKEGAVTVLDDGNGERVKLGKLDATHYGLAILDENGNPRVQGDERGLIAPEIPATAVIVTASAFTTSSTVWFPAYFLTLPEVAHAGLELHVDWRITGADAFELKVGAASPLIGETNAIAVAGPASGTAIFRWLHGQPLGASPFGFALTVRRTAGAGSIDVFWPTAWGRSPEGCTAAGV